MSTWFTSDLHFGHSNIARFCDRPFEHGPEGVPAMNEAIVELWNDTVADDDDVWILGDIVMGKKEEGLALLARLRGKKHAVAGNHDPFWMKVGSRSKAERWMRRFMEEGGLTSIQDMAAMEIASRGVRLYHFPYIGDHEGQEDRYQSVRLKDRGAWLLCGHVHEAWRQRGRQINVGIDAWGGRLVALEEIEALINEGPQDRERLAWV